MRRRFFLLEEQSLMRRGIVSYLSEAESFACAGWASSAADFFSELEKCERQSALPDILISDLNISGKTENGLFLIRECKKQFPEIEIIVYTAASSTVLVKSALEAGALAYILKSGAESELKNAIYSVFEKKLCISPSLTEKLLRYEHELSKFTRREADIINQIMRNKSNADIAGELCISKRTVENCISRIYTKTGFCSRDELRENFSGILG